MSSFNIVGFFGLCSGRRVQSDVTRADGTVASIWHVIYDTSIICSQPPSLPAELRRYSPANDIILPDDTVAFVIAKVYVPPGNVAGDVLLEPLHVCPIPGDPSRDEYYDAIPDFSNPLVFARGCVTAPYDTLHDGAVTFPVALSSYVRGSVKHSVIECHVNKSSPRWKNVPAPTRGSLINIIGKCSHVTPSGNLCLELEDIVFSKNPPVNYSPAPMPSLSSDESL